MSFSGVAKNTKGPFANQRQDNGGPDINNNQSWNGIAPFIHVRCSTCSTVSIIVTPILRRRIDDKLARDAENQTFLVELISDGG